MNRQIRSFGLALVAATLLTPALAQSPPKPQPPLTPDRATQDPQACAHTGRGTVGQGGHESGGTPQQGRSLSRKLAQSNGVICPPTHIDPHIDKPAPPGGRMPVIPPPGTPGGDRHVVPK